jgi:copper oxidase (laccase) domain-containing protein
MSRTIPFLAPLNAIPGVRAAWIERVPDLPITGDRDTAMRQLRPIHEAAVQEFAGPKASWWRAEQVHGRLVAVVPGPAQITAPDGLPVVPGADGLLTCQCATVLTIYVADCGVIWLADRKTGAIGLLHSGKLGTASNILDYTVKRMVRDFSSRPADMIAVLGPCIRPPDYEIDFAARIAQQAHDVGIGNFIDCGLNTASDPARFYSYRKELGKTGRMMALIVRDTLS